ncbi:hypothetical protein ACI2U9_01605 [Ralstonia nicotianae]
MDKNFFRQAAELADEAITALAKYEASRGSGSTDSKIFNMIRNVGVIFTDGDKLESSVKAAIPLKQQHDFTQAVYTLVRLSSLQISPGKNAATESALHLIKATCQLLATEPEPEPGSLRTVFYSWQSQLPNNTNRGFINDSLERAIKDLNSSLKLEARVGLDSDTSNTPGSPDVINTILQKIDSADIFVADISLMTWNQPNCNVMFELGYAMKSLGDKKIIMLFNETYGKTKDLPFDLGFKRQLIYRCAETDENKADMRRSLATRLRNAIELILSPSNGS